MGLVNSRSLAKTIDNVNAAFFFGQGIAKQERRKVAQWIAARQGLKDSYNKMFAPTTGDLKGGIRVFTGEKIVSSAALRHVLGEETSRVLFQLNVSNADVHDALKRAQESMMKQLTRSKQSFYKSGMFCCGTCTVSLWRNLLAGGLDDAERRFSVGIRALKKYREGNGRWRRFPFYYTLLALSEIDLPSARSEMKYTALLLEKFLKRKQGTTKINQRRRVLAERILSQV